MGKVEVPRTWLLVGLLSLLLAMAAPAVAQGETLSGRWVGGFRMEGRWTPVMVQFRGKGSYLLYLRSGCIAPLAEFSLAGAQVRFRAQGASPLVFRGRLTRGAISGWVSRGDKRGVFYLAQAGDFSPGAFEAFIGDYEKAPGELLLVTRADGRTPFYMYRDEIVRIYSLGERRFISEKGELLEFAGGEGGTEGVWIRDFLAPGHFSSRYAPRVQPYREEPVQFESEGFLLVGSLLLPLSEGPHPAVLFLHGAGASERHFYRIFADYFARQGIVALIYDQRGSGGSAESLQPPSLETLASDALAGVRYLMSRPEVNPGQVGLWGLSQGGRVAPMAASQSADIAFVMALSAPGFPRRVISLWHEDVKLRSLGCPQRMQNIAFKFARLRLDGESLLDADYKLDPLAFWRSVRQPVLLAYGGRDEVIPPDDSAAVIAEALSQAGNEDYTVLFYPQANHNLMVSTEEGTSALAQGLLEAMSAWVKERAQFGEGSGREERPHVVPGLNPTGEFSPLGRYGFWPWYGRIAFQAPLMLALLAVFLGLGLKKREAIWIRVMCRVDVALLAGMGSLVVGASRACAGQGVQWLPLLLVGIGGAFNLGAGVALLRMAKEEPDKRLRCGVMGMALAGLLWLMWYWLGGF